MSQGVVFKQRYKSRNISSTPTLNRKHLAYIATRPGAVHNPGCGFGLWGRLPGIREPENINNLKEAKKIITQVSRAYTLYRAVISVDDDTAKEHALYRRKTWEGLLNRKIHILADEMGIQQKNFCWMASMHYAKGHPHVHIMYWDNSDTVHQEFVPKERFEIIAEKVRSEFGRDIYQDEIRELRTGQRQEVDALRLELRAMLKEANLEEALSLSHISSPAHDSFTRSLAELAATVPTKGRLAYKFLNAEYKEKLNAFIDDLLKISDFNRVWKQYEKAALEVSSLHGNGEDTREYVRKEAKAAFYRNLGNEVMDYIRKYRKEMILEASAVRSDLQVVVQSTALIIATANPLYQELQKLMPRERTPMWELLKEEEFRSTFGKLVNRVCDDIRISTKIRGYVESASKDMEAEDLKVFRGQAYKDAKRDISLLLQERLQEDAEYPQQYRAELVTNLLIRLLGDASRASGQQQAQRDLLWYCRDLSKTAKRNRRVQREHGGAWSGLEQ